MTLTALLSTIMSNMILIIGICIGSVFFTLVFRENEFKRRNPNGFLIGGRSLEYFGGDTTPFCIAVFRKYDRMKVKSGRRRQS